MELTSTVYNMDCMEAMQSMEDNAFDLAVVDPPYGISAGREKPLNTFGDTCTRLRNAGDGEKKIHPTQKPVCLYDWIMDKYAKPGMKILDTHVGSGSSRIAAYKAGCDFVGCEIDKTFFEAQDRRFRNALDGVSECGENQLKLF